MFTTTYGRALDLSALNYVSILSALNYVLRRMPQIAVTRELRSASRCVISGLRAVDISLCSRRTRTLIISVLWARMVGVCSNGSC